MFRKRVLNFQLNFALDTKCLRYLGFIVRPKSGNTMVIVDPNGLLGILRVIFRLRIMLQKRLENINPNSPHLTPPG